MSGRMDECWELGCRNKISGTGNAYCPECLTKIKEGTILKHSPFDENCLKHNGNPDPTIMELEASCTCDEVNNPAHYNSLDARCDNCNETIKCIWVMEALPTNLATALKYIWRCDYKGKKQTDIEKAIWYLQRELKRINKQ
jgi:hypothetical protein